MRVGDRALRNKAIPFRASWWDDSGAGNSEWSGDVQDVIGTGNGNGGSIRLVRPAKGQLISARLTMNGVTPVLSPTTLRFAVGTFAADGVTPVAPDSATIAKHHKILTGFSAPIDYGSQDVVFIDGIDFAPLIPKRGEANFSEDGWVLYVELINRDPSDWTLFQFKVDCQFVLGLL